MPPGRASGDAAGNAQSHDASGGSIAVNDDISVLRTAVADLVPTFQGRAAEAEQLRTMPADLVLRAKQAGLFRLNLPRSLGGYELEPAVTVEIFEEISRADGSAGWLDDGHRQQHRLLRLAGACGGQRADRRSGRLRLH
jgi:alkylation response protein AidB-like acyl-CoA dehydrogenase